MLPHIVYYSRYTDYVKLELLTIFNLQFHCGYLWQPPNFIVKSVKLAPTIICECGALDQTAAHVIPQHPSHYALEQGCAIFFSDGPNTNKHNILQAASSNKIIFYRISKTILPVIKIKPQ